MSNPPPAWDKLQFKIDPDNVHATPDFSKREVIWTVGLTSATKLTTGMNYYENQLNRSVPMKVGKVYRLDQLFEPSQPRIWVVTLGDNQRFPVFALGFRISQEPTPPSPTPDKEASRR